MNNGEKKTESLLEMVEIERYKDRIPVPMSEFVLLIRKQVELDLIYAAADSDKYGTDTLVKKLFKLRFGREAGGDNNA